MEIQFYGANCITISTKQARVVIDDNLQELGGKPVAKEGDILLYTGPHGDPALTPHLLIDHAGEYEVSNVAVYGIPVRGHIDEAGQQNATAYKIIVDDTRIFVTGHMYPELNERQLENIGVIDIMFVPVGGNGYTTDGVGAMQLIKKVEPKLVVPTHYADKGLSYPVPQQTLEEALAHIAMEPHEAIDKLRVKSDVYSETMQLQILSRTP